MCKPKGKILPSACILLQIPQITNTWCELTLVCTIKNVNTNYVEYGNIIEPVHETSNNVVCATSKASDQPAQTCSLIRAFASHLSIL